MAPLNTAMTELLGRGELPVGAITSAHVGSTEEVLGLPYVGFRAAW